MIYDEKYVSRTTTNIVTTKELRELERLCPGERIYEGTEVLFDVAVLQEAIDTWEDMEDGFIQSDISTGTISFISDCTKNDVQTLIIVEE